MFRNRYLLALFTWRYLFAKHTTQKINAIIWITIMGIAIATSAMVIILGAFSALEKLNQQGVTQFVPDLRMLPKKGKILSLSDIDPLKKRLNPASAIQSAGYIQEKAYMSANGTSQIVMILGVPDHYYQLYQLDTALIAGDLPTQNDSLSVILSSDLAEKLGIGLVNISPIQLMIPKTGDGIISKPEEAFNSAAVLPVGVFECSNVNYSNVAIMPIRTAQHLLNLSPENVNAIDIVSKNYVFNTQLQSDWSTFSNTTKILTNQQINAALYKLINTEKLMAYLIFLFILIIGLFNMAATLVTLIIEKRHYFFIISTMGLDQTFITSLFFFLGLGLIFISSILGIALGVIVLKLQQNFALIPITLNPYQTIPYPVEINVQYILFTAFTVFVIGLIINFLVVFLTAFSLKRTIHD